MVCVRTGSSLGTLHGIVRIVYFFYQIPVTYYSAVPNGCGWW
jgi:hypothetical protein